MTESETHPKCAFWAHFQFNCYDSIVRNMRTGHTRAFATAVPKLYNTGTLPGRELSSECSQGVEPGGSLAGVNV